MKEMTTHARGNLTEAKGDGFFSISRGAHMSCNMRPADLAVFTGERR